MDIASAVMAVYEDVADETTVAKGVGTGIASSDDSRKGIASSDSYDFYMFHVSHISACSLFSCGYLNVSLTSFSQMYNSPTRAKSISHPHFDEFDFFVLGLMLLFRQKILWALTRTVSRT